MKIVQQFLSEHKLILLVFLMVMVENNLFAATYYSVKDGDFNNNKTWSTTSGGKAVKYPGAGHTYIIQPSYNVNLNASLNVGQVIVESGGTLTVNGNRSLTSPLTIDSGGAMVLDNNRTLTMVGDLTNLGSITTTTGSIVMDTYTFTNSGTVTISTTGSINRTTGALTNSGTITMGSGQFTSTTGSFTNTNSGTLTITGAATVTLGTGDFINSNSSANVDFGSVDISVDGTSQSIGGFTTTGLFSNTNTTGTITLTGNVIAGGFTNNGAGNIDLGTGKIHTISGDWTNTAGTVLGNTSTLEVSGTVSVAGTFTANTGTIAFNGTGSQTIPALNYYNLDGSGGNRTLANSGTIGIARDFTPGAGTYTIAGSTVNFNGSSAQTIPKFNFNNLDASGGDRILENNGTIGIAGVFTPGGGSYTITGSTVSFNGSGSQIIPVFNYNHLDGTGGNRTLANNGTIGIAGNFTPGAGVYTITGSTVNLNGSGAQTLSGTKIFYNLTLSNAGTKTLGITTVNNILSIEGTATAAAAPSYGASSTLKYNTSTSRTAGAEWVSPFTGTGGVIIANAGAITTNGNKVFNLDIPLTINSSATLTPAAGHILSFGGDFINNGTWTTSTGAVTIALTRANQKIGAFSTTGTINMTKVSGVATFTGNINGGGLTFSGAGTLDLGTDLVHVITGNLAGSASTLNGNTSTIRIGGAVTANIAFNPNTGTVDYNGTVSQTIPAVPYYYNLQTSGANTKALGGATTVQGVFTNNTGATFSPGTYVMTLSGAGTPFVNNGTFNAGTSTISFSNTGLVNIPALSYYNLNGSGGPRVLATGPEVIGIANTFTSGGGAYTVTGSTVSFNGSGAQTIPEFTFHDVILENAGDKTIDTEVSVKNITIETGPVLNLNSTAGGALNLYVW